MQTVVLASRVSADDEAVEGEGDERQPSQGGAEEEQCYAESRHCQHAHREDHRQHVH